ncbi:hypothetical protein SAMN02745121_01316 [Nannocystis exedens]|uniref:Quinol:cytochrome c oxidoreductase quinone-binding subunit 2 n=1 Tax=Nannocystis exedens TaxID=54 RepID=A0A1I1UXS6_9BACT|nr:hypothetical protein [Nannocystis exedens]PCC72107.1 hypothetical protein NAEX_05186 [Nannocystis exedens]SFD74508.1 hypothetical protein SAMN02745121_01316 [Nannocystis exedens]
MTLVLGATLVLTALAAAAGRASPAFLHAWLLAWLLWLGVALGAFVFLCIHHLVRGRWGDIVRPLLAAMTRTLPLLALLFLPIALDLDVLYPWTDREWLQAGPLRAAKAAYLDPSFFLARAVVILVAWSALASRLARPGRRPGLAALALVVFFVTITIAAVDWVLSLDPDMSTSAFGLALATGDAVAGWSVVVIAVALVHGRSARARLVVPERAQQLGTLLFAALMLWAYIAFTQFLLVWGADLPREVGWFLPRIHGDWGGVAWALVGLHFAVPFVLLLQRPIKRALPRLAAVATWLLLMHAVELLWLVVPSRALPLGWLDLAVPPGLGALWVLAVVALLGRGPLVGVAEEDIDHG